MKKNYLKCWSSLTIAYTRMPFSSILAFLSTDSGYWCLSVSHAPSLIPDISSKAFSFSQKATVEALPIADLDRVF